MNFQFEDQIQERAFIEVLVERKRQLTKGYDPAHDDEHTAGEIGAMAAFYAMPDACRDWPATETGYGATWGDAIRPEGWVGKTGDRVEELTKAAALVMAELERELRARGGF